MNCLLLVGWSGCQHGRLNIVGSCPDQKPHFVFFSATPGRNLGPSFRISIQNHRRNFHKDMKKDALTFRNGETT